MIGVTGANGLLGSFIVRELLKTKQDFVAFRRATSDTSLLDDVADAVTWRTIDLTDPVSVEDALQGITAVIHAAAIVSFHPRDARKISDVNVIGTRHLIHGCLAQKVKRFVHISSVGALGRIKGQTLIDETNHWVDNPFNTVYGKSKYLAELEVFRGQEEGLSTVIVNPSVILAPADWSKSSARLFRYAWQERPFYVDGALNYVDVRDVAAVTVQLLHAPVENERFIVSAGSVSFKDFFDSLARLFGKKRPSVQLGRNVLRIAARLEMARAWVTGTDPLITPETARLAGSFFRYENNKIKKTLQFEFQTLDNTLTWCSRYYSRKFGGKKA